MSAADYFALWRHNRSSSLSFVFGRSISSILRYTAGKLEKMNAEEVKVGCFQMIIVVLLSVNYVIVSTSHALPAFHNYTPKFYCHTKNATNRTYGCQVANSSIEGSFDSTSGESFEVGRCPGEYRFAVESGVSSVVTEWGLVCEKEFLTFLGPSVYHFGVLIGAWIAGILADRIGRLPIQAICLYTQGTMAVALYVTQNYPTFLALRGLQGVFVQGLQNSTYILSLELFPAVARTFVAFIMQVAWAFGLILLAALSYAIPDWRILQLAISVPTAITVLYIWIIPEPPRWLLAKGKSTEADMALERIAKYNGCCSRTHREDSVQRDVNVNRNVTPVKPERKSRLSTVDLQKAKTDEITQEEATNLLTPPELAQQKVRKTSLQVITEDLGKRRSNVESSAQKASRSKNEIERREKPSGSKYDRQVRSVSQPVCNQRISLKNIEDIVELRSAAKNARKENEKAETENDERANEKIDEDCNKKLDRHMRDLFKRPLLRKYCLVLICQWFTSSMACHIVETHTPNFNINRHVNFALGSALEIASYTFIYFVLSRYGRRLPMSIYQLCNGVICITIAALNILPSDTAVWMDLAKTVILLFGRVAMVSTISIIYLYSVEIFPTVIRGTCLGLCVAFAKIGSLGTPHVMSLSKHVAYATPLTVGVFCLAAAVLALMLPETLNKILPDTVDDVEHLHTNREREQTQCVLLNNDKVAAKEDLPQQDIIREKLFSEDWVDAGNGILVNFSENKGTE